jgi:hypothetical protein
MWTYDSNAVIIEVSLLVELLFELSMLAGRSKERACGQYLHEVAAGRCGEQGREGTHCTPPGCRAVLLTVLETMVRSEVEW